MTVHRIPAGRPTLSAMKWVALVWFLLCVGCCVRIFLQPLKGSVYSNYSQAGRAWVNGADPYDIDREGGERVLPVMSGYRYSPPVSVLFVPFSLFPDRYANVLWRMVSYLGYSGALIWFLRVVLPGGAAMTDKEKALFWLLLIPLSLGSMNNGQANVLLMALMLAACAAVVEKRWNLSAAFLAGAVLLKLYPLAIAMLLIVVYPRQLGWRFLLALAIGLLIPFALQRPAYVLHQYDNWFLLLRNEDRTEFAMNAGLRDFYLLTRYFGVPMAAKLYLGLRLLTAALVAGVGLLGRLRGWPENRLVATQLTLGCAWLAVFGPVVESCTFILISAPLAWSLVDSFQPGRSLGSKLILLLVLAMFLLPGIAGWFPEGAEKVYILQPLAALLFLLDRFTRSVGIRPSLLHFRLTQPS